jgi:hypothetical protein
MWQVVASVQKTVALLSTEQAFKPGCLANARRLSQKGRDVASFGGVLEALTVWWLPVCW